MATFGNRPEDSVTDSKGNVRPGVVITVFATEADAISNRNSIGSKSAGSDGRWPIDLPGKTVVWAREPNGSVWSVASDTALSDHETRLDTVETELPNKLEAADISGKADVTYVDTGLAAKLDTTTADSTFAAQAKLGIVLPDSVSYADLQAAADSAATFGTRLWAAGSLTTTSTLTLLCDADLTGLDYDYTGTGTAVVVGSAVVLNRKQISLPKITYGNKGATGWDAGTEGVRIINTNGCTITVDRVTGFETGMTVYGQGQGNVHNTFNIGHLENNKRNQVHDADATGWANSNLFVGGRYSHESAEGTSVAGTRHILLKTTPNVVNGNTWLNPSVEGVENEFCIDIDSGQYNLFLNPRTERTGGALIRFGAGAISNKIIGGYSLSTAVITRVSGNAHNTIESANRYEMIGSSTDGVLRMMNESSSGSPAISVYEPGQFDSNYSWRFAADAITGKRPAEANPRIQFDRVNGRIYLGSGTGALAMYFGPVSTSGIALTGGNLYFGTDNTQDIGLAGTLRPRYIRAGTAIQTGAGTSRPSASTAGAGAMFFDTTLGKPIWSTGSAWVDATGATV